MDFPFNVSVSTKQIHNDLKYFPVNINVWMCVCVVNICFVCLQLQSFRPTAEKKPLPQERLTHWQKLKRAQCIPSAGHQGSHTHYLLLIRIIKHPWDRMAWGPRVMFHHSPLRDNIAATAHMHYCRNISAPHVLTPPTSPPPPNFTCNLHQASPSWMLRWQLRKNGFLPPYLSSLTC